MIVFDTGPMESEGGVWESDGDYWEGFCRKGIDDLWNVDGAERIQLKVSSEPPQGHLCDADPNTYEVRILRLRYEEGAEHCTLPMLSLRDGLLEPFDDGDVAWDHVRKHMVSDDQTFWMWVEILE